MAKIKDLNPAEYNPRKISDKQMELLDKTLHEFGDLSGIVYNVATNTLVGGHQRIKNFNSNSVIDKTPFIDEVGTVAIGYINTEIGKFSYREVNWSLEKEKAANVAANKSGGEWDFTKLKDLMEDLDTGELDLELTGFDTQEIENLMTFVSEDKKNESKDLSDRISTSFKIEIECESELLQEDLFNEFQQRGFKCRILTL